MPDKKLICLLSLLIPFFLQAQHARQVEVGTNNRVQIQERVTAVVVKAEQFSGNEITFSIAGKVKKAPLDPDAPEFTYFLSLENPVSSGAIEIELEIPFKLFLINSGRSPEVDQSGARLNQQDCSFEFSAIPQSEWRAGLTPPSYNRSFTNVSHVVVHHAAGSNTNTNYTQVVRDIYVLHTEVNGWSDIGYNYLIAQNGTIYTGRDPDGGEQDNVLGAHFCGSNSTTMGICLLGNYQTATQPTEIALESLVDILSFKLQKEELDPFGTYPHAFGELGSIIGHRDGCNTSCPGDNVYQRLEDLRIETAGVLIDCDELTPVLNLSTNKTTIKAGEQVTFQNQSAGYSEYKWILEGADPEEAFWEAGGTAAYETEGVYDVTLIGYLNEDSDTLYLQNLITVESMPELEFTYNKFRIDAGEEVAFTNESNGYDSYLWILEGADPPTATWLTSGTAQYHLPGTFSVSLIGISGAEQDTLTLSDIITVESDPVIYPNPAGSTDIITIASISEITRISIRALSGKNLKLNPLSDGSFQVPDLSMGMYFIVVETMSGSYTKKLLVQ